jgi:superfamily I DNA and/or RNA helicase
VTQVCIITFYAGQVLCINKALERAGMGGGMRVMTVDSFQGSECDVVILSFVRSNSRGSVGFVKGYQRLNVALTRAKHLLICVGCAETLRTEQDWKAEKEKDSTSTRESNHLAEIIYDAGLRDRLFLGSQLFN